MSKELQYQIGRKNAEKIKHILTADSINNTFCSLTRKKLFELLDEIKINGVNNRRCLQLEKLLQLDIRFKKMKIDLNIQLKNLRSIVAQL